jgi:hypothetical protein
MYQFYLCSAYLSFTWHCIRLPSVRIMAVSCMRKCHWRNYCGAYTRCWAGISKQTMGRRPLLCNSAVNTFPLKRLRMQRWKRGFVYAVRAEELKAENWGNNSVELCKGGWEEKIRAQEAEKSPLLEAAARQRLLKPQQPGEDLECSYLCMVEISDIAVITCTSEWCV